MSAADTPLLAMHIWFARLAAETGLGMARARRLVDHFGSIEQVFYAHEETVSCVVTLPPQKILRLRRFLQNDALRHEAAQSALRCAELQIGCITDQESLYPDRLHKISNRPFLLFYRGDLAAVLTSSVPVVTVVGTRSATAYGKAITQQMVDAIARAGVTVVSGLARGIDAIAHRATLAAGGHTAAVLAGGIDHVYPPEHRALMEEIASTGVLVSEHGPGVRPVRSFFAARNRILAGLADAVLVTEAADQSGSMITASFAADQGRDLFAVPGSIFEPNVRGCNRLIRAGALACLEADDLLYRLPIQRKSQVANHETAPADERTANSCVLDCLHGRSLTAGEIAAATNIPMESLLPMLSSLEWKGEIGNRRGRFFLTPVQL